jgi:hypothetical protein
VLKKAGTHELERRRNLGRPETHTLHPLVKAAAVERERNAYRATRRTREPPSDAEIERGLREKAVTDPRAAEILLRWLQRPRQDNAPGVDLDGMSEAQLERLHAGLVKLASMDDTVLAALVQQVLAGDELVSSL